MGRRSAGQAELQRYLTLATWGLWGQQRWEIRNELEEHILERADGLMVFGVPPHEAISRALCDLGPPERVCAGMNQVYLMPKIIRLSALSALLVTLGLSGLTTSAAQVAVTNQYPNTPICAKSRSGVKSNAYLEVISRKGDIYCYRFREPDTDRYYLSVNSLVKTLQPLGVQIRQTGEHTEFRFPGSKAWNKLRTSFVRNGDCYADLRETSFNFLGAELSVKVTGWTNPTVEVGSTKFTLGNGDVPVPGSVIYQSVMMDVGEALKLGRSGFGVIAHPAALPSLARYYRHHIHVDAPAGTIVGIFSQSENDVPLIDEGPVDQDGYVTLSSRHERLQFVAAPGQLTPYLSGGRGQALLVRLTGLVASPNVKQNGKYEIIKPVEATSDATK